MLSYASTISYWLCWYGYGALSVSQHSLVPHLNGIVRLIAGLSSLYWETCGHQQQIAITVDSRSRSRSDSATVSIETV